ncbi:MAG: HD domain-containing protein [Candidatus Marsarchaeota archaeon]|nr:HD domain-containing protein [Candidatus Marsarchaeota archaeon]MCL5112407.1 HD domain-containing protein [Candidatus Marsarchaeota archaeon]
MLIRDINYGSFDVREPVLIELVSSNALDRLKRIGQMGIPQEYYPFATFSRYEHSIGVMLLLRKLGADLEEQAAGLLHDASHTAFSHTIDWAIGKGMEGNEDLQDSSHVAVLALTDVPKILERYGYDFGKISEIKRYRLLERSAPDLCADRLDYALKEFYYWENKPAAKLCADDLTVFDGKIVFKSKKSATVFGENYMTLQNKHWGGVEAVTQYYIMAKIIKLGLEHEVISLDDLMVDDQYVMSKLKGSGNVDIDRYFRLLSYKGTLPKSNGAHSQRVVKKFRYVDPEYIEGDSLVRLSEQDNNYKDLLRMSRERNMKGVTISLDFDAS